MDIRNMILCAGGGRIRGEADIKGAKKNKYQSTVKQLSKCSIIAHASYKYINTYCLM